MNGDMLTQAIQLLRSIPGAAEYVPCAVELVDELELIQTDLGQWSKSLDATFASIKDRESKEAKQQHAEYTIRFNALQNRYTDVLDKISKVLATLPEKFEQNGQTT